MRPVANGVRLSASSSRPNRIATLVRLHPADFTRIQTFAVAHGLAFNEAIAELSRIADKALAEAEVGPAA
jgi:hypothetical protein